MKVTITFDIKSEVIDKFIKLDRRIKALQDQKDDLRTLILDRYGEGTHRGELGGVNVSHQVRTVIDYRKIFAKYDIPARVINANTSRTCSDVVKVVA